MNRQKLIFYSLLIILIVTRIIHVINSTYILDGIERQNLSVSSNIASGIAPSLWIFQENVPHAGGGHLIYNLIAVPFIWFFGSSFFSLRLASVLLVSLTYILIYKFCNKYFGLKTAIFSSLLFIIAPESITTYSITGDGRHFHLNLFFILSLYLFSKIKETEKTFYYLLFGLVCGLGAYFYPAFLITIFVFGLFLLWDIDLSKPSLFYKYLIAIIWIIIAGNFLCFGSLWYNTFYGFIIGHAPKNIIPSGNIFSISKRFGINFFWNVPNIFGVFSYLFHRTPKSHFSTLNTLSDISLEIFRLLFLTSFLSLIWLIRTHIKVFIYNNPFAFLRKKYKIPVSKYICIFILTYIFVYIMLFSFNEKDLDAERYYRPLILSIILTIAIFLDELWKRNKFLSIFLLLLILLRGAIFQFSNIQAVSTKNFYKHYIWYDGEDTCELRINKPISVIRLMCDKLHINVCRAAGTDFGGIKNIDLLQKNFQYLSGGDLKKLRYLYQGYINATFVNSDGDIRKIISQIENIASEYRNFCYIGLGEAILTVRIDFFDPKFDLEGDRKKIKEALLLIEDNYKKYFFQGLGEGLARRFAIPYSPYITESKLYDDKILNNYLNLIEQEEYKSAFLVGFSNKSIWNKF